MTTTADTEPFPLLTLILDYEEGEIDEENLLRLFQYLVDTGTAWRLQGSYGRTAIALIEAGLIKGPVRQVTDSPEEDKP